ncbi:hypothetical protein [Streptomyces sp. NPDC055287]
MGLGLGGVRPRPPGAPQGRPRSSGAGWSGHGRALERARTAVGAAGTTPDGAVSQWHCPGLGRLITEQHLELTLAAVEAGDAELARATMAHVRLLLDTIGKESTKALSRLSTRAKWAVAGLRSPGA